MKGIAAVSVIIRQYAQPYVSSRAKSQIQLELPRRTIIALEPTIQSVAITATRVPGHAAGHSVIT
jgi:hypothetical protein